MSYTELGLFITLFFGVITLVAFVMGIASDKESDQRNSAFQSAELFLVIFIIGCLLNVIMYFTM